ncbi:acylpyruvate hydrolase [Salvia divinorum]|uniref:Acylpyruvate hydrolase n=1 Tax=Salvia divinorum TaxID=28513 RepID=A0ABD1FX73_SALDI
MCLPWSAAKGQDTFTPISSILPKSMLPDPHNVELWLKVDGQIRQKGSTTEGDVILTGTPKGAGPVNIG